MPLKEVLLNIKVTYFTKPQMDAGLPIVISDTFPTDIQHCGHVYTVVMSVAPYNGFGMLADVMNICIVIRVTSGV